MSEWVLLSNGDAINMQQVVKVAAWSNVLSGSGLTLHLSADFRTLSILWRDAEPVLAYLRERGITLHLPGAS